MKPEQEYYEEVLYSQSLLLRKGKKLISLTQILPNFQTDGFLRTPERNVAIAPGLARLV